MAKAAKKSTNTDMTNWDEELAAAAINTMTREANAGGGESFSTKDGILSFNGNPIEGNTMAVVIVDAVIANANYIDKYDPKNPSGPNCFAFGRNEADLVPHPNVVKAGTAQHVSCDGCPRNEWGSADEGKGKACGNGRRLALIPAGELTGDDFDVFEAYTDPKLFADAAIGFLKVPATSIKPFASFTKQVIATTKRPEWAIFSQITLEGKTLSFKALGKVPNELMPIIKAKHEEAMAAIEFPYPAYVAPDTKGKAKGTGFGKKAGPAPKAAAKPTAKAPAPKAAPAAKGKGKAAPAPTKAAFGGGAKTKVSKF